VGPDAFLTGVDSDTISWDAGFDAAGFFSETATISGIDSNGLVRRCVG